MDPRAALRALLRALPRSMRKRLYARLLPRLAQRGPFALRCGRGRARFRIELDFAEPAGAETARRLFLDGCLERPVEELFLSLLAPGMAVLDVGSGRGGLVQWLAKNAAQQAVGLSRGAEEVADSHAFTRSLGIANCHTVQSDAHAMGLAGSVFDAAILVDAMEHFASPERVLAEVRRALRPGGRACIRFNPWHFRSGHHLTRHIRIPWAHLVFSTDTLLAVARRVHEDLEREFPAETLKLVGVPTREEYDVLLNRITFGRFLRAIRAGGWRVAHLATTHACGPLGALAKRIPGLGEPFLKRILCVLEKTDDVPAQDAGDSPDGQPADGQPPAGVFRPW